MLQSPSKIDTKVGAVLILVNTSAFGFSDAIVLLFLLRSLELETIENGTWWHLGQMWKPVAHSRLLS